jgi:glycerol kinase
VEEIGEQWAMDRTFNSKIKSDERTAMMQTWEKAVSRARAWENS